MPTKTGKTRQFHVTEQEQLGSIVYAPGVYASSNFNDAEPAQREFYVVHITGAFAANNLNEALRMWAAAGCPEVTKIESVG